MNPALSTLACATCIGQDHQITTIAANGAVFVMFGALALVFCGIGAVICAFARRARRYAAIQADGGGSGSLL